MLNLKIQGGAVVHAPDPGTDTDGGRYAVNPLCNPSRRSGRRQYSVPDHVTCPRCLAIRAAQAA